MSVIIPFHSGDRAQAHRLIAWIQELGPQPCRFFLFTAKENQDPAILPASWQWMTDYLNYKSAWAQGVVDATGPNLMWQQAAREVQRMKLGPWLWLEPDAAPLTRDWLSVLFAEYTHAGKPCMGGVAPTGKRMSGVAIYPEDTARRCYHAMMCREIAFDMAGAEEFAKLGIHFTPLIADQFRCEPFKDQADFDRRVPVETALHHGDKTGGVIEFAKARINGLRYEAEPEVIHMGTGNVEVPCPKCGQPMLYALMDPWTRVCSCGHSENVQAVAVDVLHPTTFQRVPDRPDEITDLLNQKAQDVPQVLTMIQHLDCIMAMVGDSKPKRAVLYAELQKRGIEAGRKKRPLKKAATTAH